MCQFDERIPLQDVADEKTNFGLNETNPVGGKRHTNAVHIQKVH